MFSKEKQKLPKFSQNNKVAISAVALFIVSFSIMMFFLNSKGGEIGSANVLNEEHGSKSTESFDYLSIDSLYQAHLKNFKEPIFVTDSDGNLQYTNEDFNRTFGIDTEKLKDLKIYDFINVKNVPEIAEALNKVLQSGEILDSIGPVRMMLNEEKLVMLKFTPLKNAEKKVEKIIFVVKDLTEEVEEFSKKSEPELKKEDEETWIERLYPKIEEIENSDTKLLVDKIGYLKK